MRLTAYFFFILLFVLSMYTLPTCVRNFRRTRGSGTSKPYLCVLGIVLSVGVMVVAVFGVLFTVFARLH
jgi:hypothetical protein